ncbi:hypothetical protein C1645_862979 [Glomus cerebriforme]|uniref:Uncharacterized protein n=1 Tax=Glomus cerebriforme TaxID=658196 RepID=A0A397SIC5_9GLOM|nr:hypothetical protein C1645_862979 [Glomus cerebriforme]
MTNINIPFPDKPLEEDTNKVIDKLGIGFNKLSNKLSNLLEENHKKNDEIRILTNLEKQKDNKIEQLETKLEIIIKIRKDEKNDYKMELKEHTKTFNEINNENDYLKRMNQELSDRNEQLREKNKALIGENEQLKTWNAKFKNENEKYQNFIGKATTFSLNESDESDENHSVQFVKDIEELQRMLENYVGTLRKVDLNFGEINKLLYTYKCKAQLKLKPKENELQLVKAVLQRHVLEEIINDANHHLSKTESLESVIYELITLFPQILVELSTKRDGANDITRAWPIKMRQHIFEVLGSLGFSNIIDGKNKQEHPVISDIKAKLNASINNLRKYKGQQRSKLHNDMAIDLIREVIRIFLFRLKVQEPFVRFQFFPYNTKIDPSKMEGRWGNEDMDDNLLVELCSFPLLITDNDEKDRKIYARAKIVHQERFGMKLSENNNFSLGSAIRSFVINTVSNFYFGNSDGNTTAGKNNFNESLSNNDEIENNHNADRNIPNLENNSNAVGNNLK